MGGQLQMGEVAELEDGRTLSDDNIQNGGASTGYHFDADQRQTSWNAILHEVQQHTGPFIVCGGLGPTLTASCDHRWPAPVTKLSEDVKDPSRLSALVCGVFAFKVEGVLGARTRVLIIHCEADPAVENSGEEPPAVEPARKKHRVSESSSGSACHSC